MENKELISKAKGAKSVAELMALAQKHNMEMTEESATAYYELLNQKAGEVSDDELNNVSGGSCYNKGRKVVTYFSVCDAYQCEKCLGRMARGIFLCEGCGGFAGCGTCHYCIYEKGLWLCVHPRYTKN